MPEGAPTSALGARSGAPSGLRPSSFVMCNTPVEVQFITSAGCLNYPCRTPSPSVTTALTCVINWFSRSEIRLARNGDVIVEQILVVLGAGVLGQFLLHASVTPLAPPGLIEGVGIVHHEGRFQTPAALGHGPALDHVQLVGMRRAVGIDDRLGVLPNGVDDQGIAFIMSDRLAIP